MGRDAAGSGAPVTAGPAAVQQQKPKAAHRHQPGTARAPAGHRSPTRSWTFRPLYHRPHTLELARPRPRVRAGSAVPRGVLYACSSGAQSSISAAQAPPKSAIWRRSPSPTPYTCITATRSSLRGVMLIARWAGMLGALAHRSQPVQRPYSSRNRKPFRAGVARPAGRRGWRGQRSGTHLDRHRSR